MNAIVKIFVFFVSVLMVGCASGGNGAVLVSLIDSRSTDYGRIAELSKNDPDAKTADGYSCLYYAVKMERLDIAEVMAVSGARMTSGEAHILFDVEKKKTSSRRYKFMEPMFPSQMAKYADGVPPENQKFYVCRPGDHPKRIAKKLRCSVDALLAANPEVDFDLLREGQKLLVPKRGK